MQGCSRCGSYTLSLNVSSLCNPVYLVVWQDSLWSTAQAEFTPYLITLLPSCLQVAGLLPKDELDMIVNDIRPVMKAQAPGVLDTWENLYAFFLNRVRDNLHMVLCFSPVGEKFSRRAMQFPGAAGVMMPKWAKILHVNFGEV